MPTIPELPSAQQSGAQDEIPVSQAGVTREVTVAELLSGTQQIIEVPSPSILGRASLGPGGPEALNVGLGLTVLGSSLAATGGDHGSFVQETAFAPTDEVILNAGGTPKRLPISALHSLFSAGSNVAIGSTGIVSASTDPSVSTSLANLTQGLGSAQGSVAALAAKIPAGGFASLNGNGQVTAPVAGDASLASVAVTGAFPRTLSARSLDVINVIDFGASVGGADCSSAFNAAFAQLAVTGGQVFVPAGDYWLMSPLTINGKAVHLRGAGRGQTRIHLQHTGIGFDFAPANLFNKVVVSSLSIYADCMAGQTACAIRLTYPPSTAFGYVTTVVQDVELFGYPNAANGVAPFPQTFQRGLVLNNCWSSQLDGLSWFGPPAPSGATSSAVIELNGSIDTRISGLQAYYGNTVVLQTGYCEGIYLNNPLVVAADYFFTQTDETRWAGYVIGRAMLLGLWVTGGEVNTNLGTMQLSNVTDVFVSNLDITRDLGPNSPETFFNLLNVSNLHVSGCNFVGGPTGGNSQDVAFQFNSTANSSSNIISGCHFEDLATVIEIVGANGTVGLTAYGLNLSNVPLNTAFVDPTPLEASNYISFVSPGSAGTPAGLSVMKDFVVCNSAGNPLLRVNNVASAANLIRHQPATTGNAPTLCFDGTDSVVGGVLQTKGGNLTISAAGGTAGGGNLATLTSVVGATNWITLQNASPGNLSLVTTNAGGLGLQPKGALWLTPSGGLFLTGLPTSKPANGSGQVWNNNGVLSIS